MRKSVWCALSGGLICSLTVSGCLGIGVGSLRSKYRTNITTRKDDGEGHVAPSGYAFVVDNSGMDLGNLFGADLGWKLGPSWTSIPGQGMSVGKSIELHLDVRLSRFMLSGGYSSEGGSSGDTSLTYGGWFGQLSYFHPLPTGNAPFDLYLHGGAAIQDGTVAYVSGANTPERDFDTVGFRGTLGVSCVLKTGNLGGLVPDLMLRTELRYTRTGPVSVVPDKPTGFSAIGVLGEVLVLW